MSVATKHLPRQDAVLVFLVFALAYFFSALVRAITATLSPILTQELGLRASDLGLLAGGYFFGFALTQLPLGRWLDRYGPRRVILAFLSIAVLGCLAFAQASSFSGLLLARVLCGVGVSACLMAPLTGYRRWLLPATQLRANSWMLMTGSLGMVASTLPVQWLLPIWGWRVMFMVMALCLLLTMGLLAWQVPGWSAATKAHPSAPHGDGGYAAIWRSPYFWRMAPLGFFSYGGMVAIQTLWAGPWMTQVAGWTPEQAATGLFVINMSMLGSFWLWGWITPLLSQRGLHANRLIAWGMPLSLLMLTGVLVAGASAGGAAAVLLAAFCVSSTFVSLAQPAVGMAFPSELAGRALSAYNLVIFAGVFVVQWGMGLVVDLAQQAGLSRVQSFQAALAAFGVLSLSAWLFFLSRHNDNRV